MDLSDWKRNDEDGKGSEDTGTEKGERGGKGRKGIEDVRGG